MTKVEYLAKLDKYLRKLPKEDYQEAMDYFSEYFEEAGPENEAQVIAELGTPKEAARDIISRLLDEKIIDQEKTPKSRVSMVWLAILAILSAPVTSPTSSLPFLSRHHYPSSWSGGYRCCSFPWGCLPNLWNLHAI